MSLNCTETSENQWFDSDCSPSETGKGQVCSTLSPDQVFGKLFSHAFLVKSGRKTAPAPVQVYSGVNDHDQKALRPEILDRYSTTKEAWCAVDSDKWYIYSQDH